MTSSRVPLDSASGDWINRTEAEEFPICQFQHTGSLTIAVTDTDITLHTEDFEETGFTHAASSAEITIGFTGVIAISWTQHCDSTSGTRGTLQVRAQEDTGGGYADITGLFLHSYIRQPNSNGAGRHPFWHPVTSGDKLKFGLCTCLVTVPVQPHEGRILPGLGVLLTACQPLIERSCVDADGSCRRANEVSLPDCIDNRTMPDLGQLGRFADPFGVANGEISMCLSWWLCSLVGRVGLFGVAHVGILRAIPHLETA